MPLIDLVIADETEAEAVGCADSPTRTFPGIDAKDIDIIKLAKLALILDGVLINTPAVLSAVQSFRLLHETSEDGPWVHHVPNRVVAALGSLDEGRRAVVAGAWAGVEEFRRDGWDKAGVNRFLDALCGLAEEARACGKGMLLWMSL